MITKFFSSIGEKIGELAGSVAAIPGHIYNNIGSGLKSIVHGVGRVLGGIITFPAHLFYNFPGLTMGAIAAYAASGIVGFGCGAAVIGAVVAYAMYKKKGDFGLGTPIKDAWDDGRGAFGKKIDDMLENRLAYP